jgi:hypothetical protein
MTRDSDTIQARYFGSAPLLAAHRDVESNVLHRSKVEVTSIRDQHLQFK